jgi:hypothetical protein
MVRRTLLTLVVGAALPALFCAPSPATAAPAAPLGIAQAVGANFDLASYWGLPYPYGYTYGHPYTYAAGYRGPCYRNVRVQTPAGLRWQRVWICG